MKIRITADLREPHTHYIRVTWRVEGLSGDPLILAFPVWSPGSYLVREYQSQVEYFTARDSQGRKLPHDKISKNRWRIDCKKTHTVVVTYSVYTPELNVRSCYLDHELGFLNPTSVFFYPEEHLNVSVTFQLKLPKGWRAATSPMQRSLTWRFGHFDDFYDMPVLAARDLEWRKFSVGRTRYTMAFWGIHAGDTAKIAAEVHKVVDAQRKMFGENPCREYVFQIIFAKGKYGGLEHANASTNMFDGTQLAERKSYLKFISLLSHEHFHLWNVKRIRPRELGPFDYGTENYSRLLWLAEGVTSFYDDQFVFRAGVLPRDEYLRILGENISTCESQKARLVNSLSDSSYDAWIRFYRPHENSLNTVTSYYLKGGLVMMLLHLRILVATRGRRSLDDVMRALWKLYGARPQLGITADEFWRIVEKCGFADARVFARDYVDGVRVIDWKKELSATGIDLVADASPQKNYLGVVLGRREGRVVIQNIAEDSPAYHSDLRSQDEVLAINGERLENDKQLENYLNLKHISLLFARFGQVYEVLVELMPHRGFNQKLVVKKKMRQIELRILKKFLRT